VADKLRGNKGMAKTPEIILQLIENFGQNLESFKSQGYNEATLRQEFINPFFEALGWDIQNKAGIAQAYKDVIHEDSIKIGTSTKAPDYCFRIGQTKKFFLEAKKPAVDIKGDVSPAYQLRRYAWSAKLPLSILTDFEEFAVYDCQIRPNVNDKATTARIFFCTYKDYADKWEQISNVFSKEAVLKGLFDKYATEKTTKRGTTTVDKEILAEIEGWRDELAKNIALRNGKLSVYDLNFAVQKTIDRILFLRICEDRGIERAEQLLGLINGGRIYPRLFELFEKADEKYNSGIFHFRREKDRPESPDELSANLKVDDDVLKGILKDLYYPHSPYEFSVMPAEILGNVYEQFLGKVIRLTAAHQAKVEEKPEVKKAGGVYYTPSYIVDYIVKNTVGKLCENKTPKQIEKIKILDPACGSGSFLIGAYQELLDYHRDWYANDGKEIASSSPTAFARVNSAGTSRNDASPYRRRLNRPVYQGKGGQWFLTIDEKKRILLNNIYGVDIDSQAAEVTKLSLLLKVLENETQESLRLFHERALPDLGNNIKCGNSLIGPDFYQNQQLGLFGDEQQQRKINAFDWQKEFSEIFKQGGFDAVIGNPPWVDIKGMNPEFVDYYFKSYSTTENRMNIYATFLHKAIDLLKSKGFLGFITPNSYLTQSSYKKLRKFILHQNSPLGFVRMPDDVFLKVKAESVIGIFVKDKSEKCNLLLYPPDATIAFISEKNAAVVKTINPQIWGKTDDSIFNIFANNNEQKLLKKISSGKPLLVDICEFSLGLTPYDKYKGHSREQIENKVFHAHFKKDNSFKPLLSGSGITRYMIEWDGKEWIKYGDWLGAPRQPEFFRDPRILVRQIISGNPLRIYCGYTEKELYNTQIAFNILLKKGESISLKYILGILNSALITFYHRVCFLDQSKNIFQKILIQDAKKFPIHIPNHKNPSEKNKYDKIINLVEEMLELHKKVGKVKNPDEKTRIGRQIDSTDKEIDKLVYELYGLSDDEIAIVENMD
jgi:type I restriction-modification system DNA methylase subunit